VDRFARLGWLSALLAWSEVANAQSSAPCPSPGEPWVEIVFSGPAWSKAAQQAILRELRIELRRRSLQVCTEPGAGPWAPPQKLITLLARDPERVAIVPSDLEHEGGFVGRTVVVAAIPEDARPLAIAQAVDEALRSDSGIAPEPPHAPSKVFPAKREAAPPSARSELSAAVAVAPTLQVAPATFDGASRAVVAPGATLRFAVMPSSVGGSLGVTITKASDLSYGHVTLRQLRLPLDASLRFRIRSGQLEAMFDVGLLAALVDYGYAPTGRGQRWVESGGRAGASIGWGRRVVPWIGASIEVLPSSSELRFAPTGSVGHTPTLWLGFALGTELRWP
jgi:hypothetical protein